MSAVIAKLNFFPKLFSARIIFFPELSFGRIFRLIPTRFKINEKKKEKNIVQIVIILVNIEFCPNSQFPEKRAWKIGIRAKFNSENKNSDKEEFGKKNSGNKYGRSKTLRIC